MNRSRCCRCWQASTAELLDGAGEPIAWPAALAGDKGYRADWIDATLLAIGISPVIPSKTSEDPDARAIPFYREAYHDRNIVEFLIGWLKECRRVLTRSKGFHHYRARHRRKKPKPNRCEPREQMMQWPTKMSYRFAYRRSPLLTAIRCISVRFGTMQNRPRTTFP